MNMLLTSIVLALVAAEPRPEAGGPPQAGAQPQVRELNLNPPLTDPAPQGEAEMRLAAYYAAYIQGMPWEWDEEKTRLSTYIQSANNQGFDVRLSSPALRIEPGKIVGPGKVVIEAQNGNRSWRATGHWNTPFIILDESVIYLDCNDSGSQAALVKVNLLTGDILWNRPFSVLRGVGGSIRHRKYSLQLAPDAVILTGQDYTNRFRAIRSLATGAQLAFRDYPLPSGAP